MTEQEYRQHPGVNKSTLWELRRSPAHYRYLLEHPRSDTPALRLGRAVHAAVLQPEVYAAEYAVLPEVDRRTRAGQEAYAALADVNRGKTLLTPSEGKTVEAIAGAVLGTLPVRRRLEGLRTEVPLFWTDEATGIPCKCRVDALGLAPPLAVDLKTTLDADVDAFAREAIRRGYDVQAAHYIRGMQAALGAKRVEWYFIAVEKDPPHAVNVIRASEGFLDNGLWRLRALLDRLKRCQEADNWSGYGESELFLPAWAEYDGSWED